MRANWCNAYILKRVVESRERFSMRWIRDEVMKGQQKGAAASRNTQSKKVKMAAASLEEKSLEEQQQSLLGSSAAVRMMRLIFSFPYLKAWIRLDESTLGLPQGQLDSLSSQVD